VLILYYNERKNIVAYVSEYGNYGSEGVIVFPDYQLTPEQWDELDVLPDNDKMSYVKGILDENELGYMEFND
jgi:hypothetical protein